MFWTFKRSLKWFKILAPKLLKQGYRYHNYAMHFLKFYRRHFELMYIYNVGLKALLQVGLSESEIYGDVVYKFR